MPIKYIRIYHFIKRRKNAKKLSLFTPAKVIKGELSEVTQREKAARDLFSTAVSKVRQPIEALFNWLNEKIGIQKAMKVQIYIRAFDTYHGKDRHHIDYSNF